MSATHYDPATDDDVWEWIASTLEALVDRLGRVTDNLRHVAAEARVDQ